MKLLQSIKQWNYSMQDKEMRNARIIATIIILFLIASIVSKKPSTRCDAVGNCVDAIDPFSID